MTLVELESKIKSLQTRFDRESAVRDSLQVRLEEVRADRDALKHQIEIGEQVRMLFGLVSEHARTQAVQHIEATVTAALQSVIGGNIRFRIILREVAGQPAAEWQVVDMMGDTEVALEPDDARGGGISDIVSIALRLATMELAQPKPGGPIFFDEPGKHVSAEYSQALAEFLREYARKTRRQIFLITHNQALAEVADVAYQVRRENGISEVHQTWQPGGR